MKGSGKVTVRVVTLSFLCCPSEGSGGLGGQALALLERLPMRVLHTNTSRASQRACSDCRPRTKQLQLLPEPDASPS